MRDYYEILGVARGSDEAALKSAFRKLAMEHHPDRNGGSEESAARFKEINEAYSVLSDPRKRAAYDQFGHAGVNGAQGGGGGGGPGFADINDIFSEVFGSAFGDMFGGGQRRSGPARGQDLRYDLEITLEQAYAGAEVEITAATAMTCEACEGGGAKPGTSPVTCPTCGGAGRVRASAAAARAGSSAIPAPPAAGMARCAATAPCRSESPPGSTTAPGSGCRARAMRAPGAAPGATSTSSSPSAPTTSSNAMAWTCTAPCPSP